MTVADYRNLRADQKNNVIVASETAFRECTCGVGKSAWWASHGVSCEYAQDLYAWIDDVPLTRTKDDSLTRTEGE